MTRGATLVATVMGAIGLLACAGGTPGKHETRGASETMESRRLSGAPSILLISLDTTRADHLGCYGSPAASTPNLDRWAREGVVFDAALTPVPVTLPAHASLLTGLLPHHHGVRDNGLYRLPEGPETLAGACRRPATTRRRWSPRPCWTGSSGSIGASPSTTTR